MIKYPGEVPVLSWLQRLHLKVFGYVYLGRREDGFPVYAVNCRWHGVYLDIPQGRNRVFRCDSCRVEWLLWERIHQKTLVTV